VIKISAQLSKSPCIQAQGVFEVEPFLVTRDTIH
jgi:hypothetical protein